MISERSARTSAAPAIPVWDTLRGPLASMALALAGLSLLALAWAAVAALGSGDLPGPIATMAVFRDLVSRPFYDAGPNEKGIGLQLMASLERVVIGFSAGTLIAIPLGVLIGVSPIARRAIDPVIQLLRPVSPLAWFPIGLLVFQSAPDAVVFIIAITSLWPTMLNTAFGVSSVPAAHKDVARVFQFSRAKYLTRVVLPYSLPHTLTGMRLSMGIAWMVIVAGEMLSGSTGIGFFIWDSWNALSVERVISAILLIGLVGLILDRGFGWAVARVSYQEAA